MHKVTLGLVVAVLLAAGCDKLASDQSKPTEGAVTQVPGPVVVGAFANSVAPASTATSIPTPLEASFRWLATGAGSKVEETGVQGKVSLAKGGILSVTALKSPIAAGDVVKVTATITGPAGRQLRAFVMRDCASDGESDNSSTFADLTGTAQLVEAEHTFANPYACVKFALIAVGGEPIDLSVADVTFLKSRIGQP